MDLESFEATETDLSDYFADRRDEHAPMKRQNRKEKRDRQALPRHREGERFVRGPIPMKWLKLASTCGSRAEAVSLLLWYTAGWQKSNPVKLTPSVLAELKVHPKTGRQVLKKMEEIGLVKVEFRRGRSPVVTITEPREKVGE